MGAPAAWGVQSPPFQGGHWGAPPHRPTCEGGSTPPPGGVGACWARLTAGLTRALTLSPPWGLGGRPCTPVRGVARAPLAGPCGQSRVGTWRAPGRSRVSNRRQPRINAIIISDKLEGRGHGAAGARVVYYHAMCMACTRSGALGSPLPRDASFAAPCARPFRRQSS
jgi:hypothetical protein